jgi:hypothetical protein
LTSLIAVIESSLTLLLIVLAFLPTRRLAGLSLHLLNLEVLRAEAMLAWKESPARLYCCVAGASSHTITASQSRQ